MRPKVGAIVRFKQDTNKYDLVKILKITPIVQGIVLYSTYTSFIKDKVYTFGANFNRFYESTNTEKVLYGSN